MGIEAEPVAPASAWRRGLLRAPLVHPTQAELDWLITEAGTAKGARRQGLGGPVGLVMGLLALNQFAIWFNLAGLGVAVLVLVAYAALAAVAALAGARRLDPARSQQQMRTLKRRPTADDPTVPADAPKRRRQVQLTRGAIAVFIPLLALGFSSPWWFDRDEDPPFVPLIGVDYPDADVQVSGVRCVLDESSQLHLQAIAINNTEHDYTITLEADVTTVDNFFRGDEQVLVPAGSSSTRIDTFTGLTSPATRCELKVVKRERIPAARGGGGRIP